MIAVYQATFFLSIALLAIVITVFVLAVSLLGRAVRISIEEQVQSEQDGLKRSQSEIANLTEQFKRAGEKMNNLIWIEFKKVLIKSNGVRDF